MLGSYATSEKPCRTSGTRQRTMVLLAGHTRHLSVTNAFLWYYPGRLHARGKPNTSLSLSQLVRGRLFRRFLPTLFVANYHHSGRSLIRSLGIRLVARSSIMRKALSAFTNLRHPCCRRDTRLSSIHSSSEVDVALRLRNMATESRYTKTFGV